MSQTPILEVRDLRVTLGQEEILSGISFDLIRGHLHALIGPNGAGKTTLIRALLGGMPHQGTIRFLFRDSRVIGYVPQLLEFDHSVPMTVNDFIAVMLQDKAVPLGRSHRVRNLTRRLLETVGALHLENRTLGRLSGGEFQRIVLAQALYPLPEVLLLDEPASNVDERGAHHFKQLLRRLCDEQGISVLMVGHDISSILRLSDRVTAINRQVVFSGRPSGLSVQALFGRSSDGRVDAPALVMPLHEILSDPDR